jgi:hypothetical protein
MGQSPPLDELAARKRLVQAKMELHRAEIALYYREVTAPLRIAESSVHTILNHPISRITMIAGAGVLFFSGRLRLFRKTLGFIAPIVLPQLRGFLKRQISGLVSDKLNFFSALKGSK